MFQLMLHKNKPKVHENSAQVAYKTLKEVIGNSRHHSMNISLHESLMNVVSGYTGIEKLASGINYLSLKHSNKGSEFALLNFQALIPKGEVHKLKSVL